MNEKLRLPAVSTGGGSGTSAADAIVVDSDQDINGVPSLSRTDTPRELPINHGTPLNQDVVSYSDSDIESLDSKVEVNPEASYHSLLSLARELSPAEVSDILSSDAPPSRALTREEDTAALCRLCSDSSDVTTSDSEVDEANGAEDIDGGRVPARHTRPPSLPSLQAVRKLLARKKGRGDPERDVLAPEVSQKQGGRVSFEEASAITSSESDEESDRRGSDPQLTRVPLPKTDHGRARRLLMPESAELPLVAVTMRGDCHFIERKEK